MHLFSSKSVFVLAAAVAGGLAVSACGGSSTDTVDNSEITEMNAAGMMEGTTNDASAMDMATDTNVATGNVADNVMTEAGGASGNVTGGNVTGGNSTE